MEKIRHTIHPTGVVIFIPRAARLFPHGMCYPFLSLSAATGTEDVKVSAYLQMSVELVSNILLRHPALDVLVLHLLDNIHSVVSNALQWSHNTSVLNRPCRSNEGDEIREVWNRQAQVGLGTGAPFVLLQVSPSIIQDRGSRQNA